MTRLHSPRWLRWAAPAVVAVGVAAAAITASNGAGASEQPTLPPTTAAQLLAAVEQSNPQGFSGTIVETAKLGLPNLPTTAIAGVNGLSLQTLLTGSHTMRVWYAGPSRQRVALLAPLAERDVIHNGTDLWTYTSTTNEVTHSTVGSTDSMPGRDALGATPQQVAKEALRAIDPTTQVTVDRTARIAGRDAYQLALSPRDSRSLIGSVQIGIDAATSMPLQVQVFAAGASAPALQIGFTDISFTSPRDSVFQFTAPANAKVTQQPLGGLGSSAAEKAQGHDGRGPAMDKPQVLGSGWTSVVALPAGSGRLTGSNLELLDRLSTPVPAGRLITTALVSVLVTDDGRVFAGPVSGAAIQQVAASGHGL